MDKRFSRKSDTLQRQRSEYKSVLKAYIPTAFGGKRADGKDLYCPDAHMVYQKLCFDTGWKVDLEPVHKMYGIYLEVSRLREKRQNEILYRESQAELKELLGFRANIQGEVSGSARYKRSSETVRRIKKLKAIVAKREKGIKSNRLWPKKEKIHRIVMSSLGFKDCCMDLDLPLRFYTSIQREKSLCELHEEVDILTQRLKKIAADFHTDIGEPSTHLSFL